MHVAIDEISSCSIAYRHHGESSDEEEGYHTKWTVVEKFHPEVTDFHVGAFLSIHDHLLLALREAEQQKHKTHESVDSHRDEPSTWVLWQAFHLLVGEIGNQQRQARPYGKSSAVSHKHPDRSEDGDFICVARQRRVQCSIRHINKGVEQGHGDISHVSIKQ